MPLFSALYAHGRVHGRVTGGGCRHQLHSAAFTLLIARQLNSGPGELFREEHSSVSTLFCNLLLYPITGSSDVLHCVLRDMCSRAQGAQCCRGRAVHGALTFLTTTT